MGRVRPFVEDDIPQVVELNTRSFPRSATLSPETQQHRFREICLKNPWFHEEIRSLVYQEDDGRIAGFLAVIPRHMSFHGTRITIGAAQHMMVDRATLASLQLFKAFISGPQELAMGDMSVDVTRKLFERIGGSTSYLHSIYWVYPLRPITYFASLGRRRQMESKSGSAYSSFTHYFDELCAHTRLNPFRIKEPVLKEEDLTPELFLANFPTFARDSSLLPVYTLQSISWLFEVLSKESRFGAFRKIAVRDHDGGVAGWYVYNALQGGRGEVLQVCATPRTISAVLDHLFHDAWRHGCTDLAGRVDPLFMKDFSEKHCLITPGRDWMLIHSRQPEIMNAIFRGDAFLTRLEGDLWFL